MAKLEVRFDNVTLKEIPLDKPSLTIGRSNKNDLVIDNMAVSRKHARIYREGPRHIVQDLKSLNGTFVNNKKVSQWILSNNDQVLIGKHTLLFIEEADQPAEDVSQPPGDVVEHTLVLETKKQKELLAKIREPAPEEKTKPVQAGVTIISGGSEQEHVELTKRLTVAGKGSHADIRLKGFFLGRTVFLISQKPNGYYISCPGRKTTTRINGLPVTDQQELKEGDIIDAGRTKMQFTMKT
jgi:pSer/pThr/pTyr-binding forkhead associated (FHA) protein